MGFSAVGVMMLIVVFIFYMRMVDARASARQRKHQVQSILEKAEVFESVAKDQDALTVIEAGLKDHPKNQQLEQKAVNLRLRLTKP